MKFTVKIALFVMMLASTLTNAQDKKPASPPATATGKINGANISVNYSSPSVKGRVIWGELVPYGQVWRAGANDATTFETDKAITIEGKQLPAGKYAFFVIPEKDNKATIIFNSEAKQWGAYKYDAAKDVLRVIVPITKSKTVTESLTYKVDSNNVSLNWEHAVISFGVK